VALWALGFVCAYVRARRWGCGSGRSLTEAATDAFANLATATSVERGIVATLKDAHTHLPKQLEENVQALKEIIALLKKERNDLRSRKPLALCLANSCYTHGYKITRNRTSVSCVYPKNDHRREATKSNTIGGGSS
jgi:hypothetical protein